MKSSFIHSKDADKWLCLNSNNTKPIIGVVTIRWLLEMFNSNRLVPNNPIYQRMFVAAILWCQGIMRTILDSDVNLSISQLHLRTIRVGKINHYEAMDGQQRITSIVSFMNKGYKLPKNFIVNVGNNKVDLSNCDVNDLKKNHPEIYEAVLDYEIPVCWYENVTDQHACHIFKMLNNNTAMTPQEMRNATWGHFTDWIRVNVDEEKPHPLFISMTVGKKKRLKHINLALKNRMEAHEYLSEIIFMLENGWKNGVNQPKHTAWVEKFQQPGAPGAKPAFAHELQNKYEFEKYEKRWTEFLKFCLTIAKAMPDKKRTTFSPMVSQMAFLYGWELKNKNNGKLDVRKYIHKFFEVYAKWSSVTKRLWLNHTMPDGKRPLPPFNELFRGKNKNAIGAITYVLDLELKKDRAGFGLTDVDSRKTFSKNQIIRKWHEQNHRCAYTGEQLDEKHIVGDHYIPRSRSGSTTYDNLVVTSQQVNQDKGAMGGDEYRAYLNRKNKQAA
jgi:hypothetical protein